MGNKEGLGTPPEDFRQPTREERAKELAAISSLWGIIEYESVTGEVVEIPKNTMDEGKIIKLLPPLDPSV